MITLNHTWHPVVPTLATDKRHVKICTCGHLCQIGWVAGGKGKRARCCLCQNMMPCGICTG